MCIRDRYNPSCLVNASNQVEQAPQTTYAMVPFQCGGTYEGQLSPNNLALYSFTAIGYINAAQVHGGTSYVQASANSGTAAPGFPVGNELTVNLIWTDTITVDGLPPGTPIQLQVTDYIPSGSFQLTPSGNHGSYFQNDVVLEPTGTATLSCNIANIVNT